MANKTHVIVTRALPVREGGRIIVHAYGPFTAGEAINTRQRMLARAKELNYADRLEVNACKVLDVAWRLGGRRLLAASCSRCGHLFPGSAFHYHIRRARDPRPYIDRRCTNCKWGVSLKGKRHANISQDRSPADAGGRQHPHLLA